MKERLVLVIDDDRRYRELLAMNLTQGGDRVILAADGLSGLNLLERDEPDLVILDLMLPDLDGFDLCRRIRVQSPVPMIILTGRGDESDKVRGLQLGADDYITKPFGAAELLARVDAVLRRDQRSPVVRTPTFVAGALNIDFTQRRVSVGGREIELTSLEYRLLYHLALNSGRVMTQEELLRRVWGNGYEAQTDVLYTVITRLRRKLGDNPARPGFIVTARGIGYSMVKASS